MLVNPDEVKPGDQVQVRPGERLAVDGEVVEGNGSFDTSALTGESLPRLAGPGTEALAGFIVKEGALTIRCTRPVSESATSRIISLVEQATRSKARAELFIRRFARWYTPAMVLTALAVAFIPPIFLPGEELSSSIYRALVILVISCPCALVLSVPLTYFAGLGGAAKQGILIKGAAVLDSLAEAETVVFDKTGTLTDGSFTIKNLVPAGKFSQKNFWKQQRQPVHDQTTPSPCNSNLLGIYRKTESTLRGRNLPGNPRSRESCKSKRPRSICGE